MHKRCPQRQFLPLRRSGSYVLLTDVIEIPTHAISVLLTLVEYTIVNRDTGSVHPSFERQRNSGSYYHYGGYRNEGLLAVGQTVDGPRNSFFAMGDNSANSADGRYWGFVPAKDVVGRPMFVYYPFTRHWGPAQ